MKPQNITQYQEEATYISIDELTVSFLHKDDLVSSEDHVELSEELIQAFVKNMSIEELGPVSQGKNINGYNVTYKPQDAQLTFSYHTEWPSMGVSVKFSASALQEYLSILGKLEGWAVDAIDVLKWMSEIARQSNFKTRLSRIDVAADYLNLDLSVSQLHQAILTEEIRVTDHRESREKKLGAYFGKGGETQTFYIGQYSTRTGFLRVYDKKVEQLGNKHSRHYEQALYCKNWVRAEAVFKDEFAHQITEKLLDADEIEYKAILASLMLSRYRFINQDDSYHTLTAELMRLERLRTYTMSINHRHYSLQRSMDTLTTGQVQNTLYKVRQIKGEEYARAYWESLYEHNFHFYKPTNEVKVFINRLKKYENAEQ